MVSFKLGEVIMIDVTRAYILTTNNRAMNLGLGPTIDIINGLIEEAVRGGKFYLELPLHTAAQRAEFGKYIKTDLPYLPIERPLPPPTEEDPNEEHYVDSDEDDDDDDDDDYTVSYEDSDRGRAITDYYRMYGFDVSFPVRNFKRGRYDYDYSYHNSYEALRIEWGSDTVSDEDIPDALRHS